MAAQLGSQLERLKLTNVKSAGMAVGKGAYGQVIKVYVHGTLCAAKEVHSILVEQVSSREFEVTKEAFLSECVKASRVLHPNVVQMLGIYYPTPQAKLPWLVMELMETSLRCFLEEYSSEKVPLNIKLSILVDIAQGLEFLHSQDIIHRDLSSNNVLLTKYLVAKIADLGVAKVVEHNKMKTHTQTPGTLYFMPPEALLVRPHYGKSVDVFSLACVALHVISHQWPEPKDLLQEDSMVARTEVQRREEYLKCCTQPRLKQLIQLCLHNKPERRPEVSNVCITFKEVKATTDQQSSFAMANQIELLDVIQQKQLEIQSMEERLNNAEVLLLESTMSVSQLEEQLQEQRHQIRSLQQKVLEAQHQDYTKYSYSAATTAPTTTAQQYYSIPSYSTATTTAQQYHGKPYYSTATPTAQQYYGKPYYSTATTTAEQYYGKPYYSTATTTAEQYYGKPYYSAATTTTAQQYHGKPYYSAATPTAEQYYGKPYYSTATTTAEQYYGKPNYSTATPTAEQYYGKPYYSAATTALFTTAQQYYGKPYYSTATSTAEQYYGKPYYSTATSTAQQYYGKPYYSAATTALFTTAQQYYGKPYYSTATSTAEQYYGKPYYSAATPTAPTTTAQY